MNWYKKALFDSNQWQSNGPRSYSTEFTQIFSVDGANYRFYAEEQGLKGEDEQFGGDWTVEFRLQNSYDPYGMSDKQVPLKVLSAVLSIMKQFIQTKKPDLINFSGRGESRIGVYQKMIDRFARSMGYTITMQNKIDSAIYWVLERVKQPDPQMELPFYQEHTEQHTEEQNTGDLQTV